MKKYKYYSNIVNGCIYRVNNDGAQMLDTDTACWMDTCFNFPSVHRCIKSSPDRFRPISPLVVQHFISEGGYNADYFIR